jgi:DNA-binding NarL/FixJ family response regulator
MRGRLSQLDAVPGPPTPVAWARRPPARPTRGLANLTPRELEVLAMIAEGASNVAVAGELFLSIRTVECYVARIFDKLGLEVDVDEHRRVKAALTYQRWAASAAVAAPATPATDHLRSVAG